VRVNCNVGASFMPECQCVACRYLRWKDKNPDKTTHDFIVWNHVWLTDRASLN
jgi:hypothetical protein